jgi:hypothetical protein
LFFQTGVDVLLGTIQLKGHNLALFVLDQDGGIGEIEREVGIEAMVDG